METIFNSTLDFTLIFFVIVLAQSIYVMFGFGAGLIAVGSLAILIPSIPDVVVLLLLVCLPSEFFVVLKSIRKISWKGILLICSGVVIGVIFGTILLKNTDPIFILTILAIFLMISGSAFFLYTSGIKIIWPGWFSPIVGIISGVLSGLFGTGGPPLILYYQLSGITKSSFRGNLMTIFLITAIARIPSYTAAGFFTCIRLNSALLLLPAAFLGIWLGNRIHIRLTEDKFRRMVSILLVIIGISLLIRRF